MEEETKNVLNVFVIVVASLCYSHLIASKIPKGILRLISLLPILALFTLLPLTISKPIPSFILSGYITWLANFKILLYAFDLGPLSSFDHNNDHQSLIRFIFLASLPIKIKHKVNSTQSQKGNFGNVPTNNKVLLPLNFWSKGGIFVILEVVFHFNKNMVVLCCLMYLAIDVSFGACNLIVGAALGLELEPPSDEPYLSTSLQDFWGRRWNLMISDALRHTIYEPIKSTTVKLVGQKWAQMTGVMASFIASGLMHELAYYYATRASPTWEVTWFFVLHGVCVILEIGVKRSLGRKLRLHWALSGPLTVGFVMVTGSWLFFPQLMRNQIDVRATQDIMEFGKYLKEVMMI